MNVIMSVISDFLGCIQSEFGAAQILYHSYCMVSEIVSQRESCSEVHQGPLLTYLDCKQ
jgi:hypothetical protein